MNNAFQKTIRDSLKVVESKLLVDGPYLDKEAKADLTKLANNLRQLIGSDDTPGTEIYATYIEGYDRTVVWQEMYIGGSPIQTTIIGWYYGEPNEEDTKRYSNSPITAQYIN